MVFPIYIISNIIKYEEQRDSKKNKKKRRIINILVCCSIQLLTFKQYKFQVISLLNMIPFIKQDYTQFFSIVFQFINKNTLYYYYFKLSIPLSPLYTYIYQKLSISSLWLFESGWQPIIIRQRHAHLTQNYWSSINCQKFFFFFRVNLEPDETRMKDAHCFQSKLDSRGWGWGLIRQTWTSYQHKSTTTTTVCVNIEDYEKDWKRIAFGCLEFFLSKNGEHHGLKQLA